jgi:hypothetical protein
MKIGLSLRANREMDIIRTYTCTVDECWPVHALPVPILAMVWFEGVTG